jgi:hypothetical protein
VVAEIPPVNVVLVAAPAPGRKRPLLSNSAAAKPAQIRNLV